MGALKLKDTKSSKSALKLVVVANNPAPQNTKKTASELAFEKARMARLAKNPSSSPAKSHKAKVEDFNQYLSKLSDHYDVPKVGPG